jgi:hypothetical protein
MYSAIVLTDESRDKVLSIFRNRIPEGWEIIAHHVTINMGQLPTELKPSIGLPVTFKGISFDMDDKVAALSVVVPQEMHKFMANDHPHVTIAVNRKGGGKPVMSNAMIAKAIADDDAEGIVGRLFSPIELMGQIQEVR